LYWLPTAGTPLIPRIRQRWQTLFAPQPAQAIPDSGVTPDACAALAHLHRAVAELIDRPGDGSAFEVLLAGIERVSGAQASAVFVEDNVTNAWRALACTSTAERTHFTSLLTKQRIGPDGQLPRRIAHPAHERAEIVMLRLRDRSRTHHGVLLLKLAGDGPDVTDASLQSLSESLGMILGSVTRARVNQRRALYQERAMIARELHDSLAQALSYLKIQVTRLQSLLNQESASAQPDLTHLDPVVQELRAHLNLAYRQLRELITTFRLTMNGRALSRALEDSLEEFENRSAIAFNLDNRLPDGTLSVDEELQVLQIIREALANAVRHSHAKRADIMLSVGQEGEAEINIDDDGVGMDATRRRQQHHGLVIMQQRAHDLGGDLHVAKSPTGGTRIQISFRSRNLAES
ncbi:MAG: ATP-binding protein, partial [Gammaproteobacteria bacterium]